MLYRSSRTWHAALAAVVGFALIVQPLLTRTTLVRLFSYFTIQSNVLVLVAALGLAINPARDGRWWRALRLDGLVGIVITGVVYSTVLAKLEHLTGLAFVVNVCFHYI